MIVLVAILMFVFVLLVFLQIVMSGSFEVTLDTAKHAIHLQMEPDLVSSQIHLIFCFKITFITFHWITFVFVKCWNQPCLVSTIITYWISSWCQSRKNFIVVIFQMSSEITLLCEFLGTMLTHNSHSFVHSFLVILNIGNAVGSIRTNVTEHQTFICLVWSYLVLI